MKSKLQIMVELGWLSVSGLFVVLFLICLGYEARARYVPGVLIAPGAWPWMGHSIALFYNLHRYLDWLYESSLQARLNDQQHKMLDNTNDEDGMSTRPVQFNLMTKPPIVVLNDVASVKHMLQDRFERYETGWWLNLH